MRGAARLAALICAALFAGCASRPAQIAAQTAPTDALLTCGHILGQQTTNARRIAELDESASLAFIGNFARIALSGPVMGLLGGDSAQAEIREAEALKRRNAVLARLAARKRCGAR